jgi:hypothetical protein
MRWNAARAITGPREFSASRSLNANSNSPKHVIVRCHGKDEAVASAHLLRDWSGIAVDRSRGTGKDNNQSGDDSCNPAARLLVHREVAAATTAAMRNAFAAEQCNFMFTGGAHRKSPYGLFRVYSRLHH